MDELRSNLDLCFWRGDRLKVERGNRIIQYVTMEMILKSFTSTHGTLMNFLDTIATQVILPQELYAKLALSAKFRGHSIDREITMLLSRSIETETDSLAIEFAQWESASDEDYLNFEAQLTEV
jgi:hypothetical protein